MSYYLEHPNAAVFWHLLLAIATAIWVKYVGFGWFLWMPALASFAFCLPIFANYFKGLIPPKRAWFLIVLSVFLSLIVLAQIHASNGIKFSGDDCEAGGVCVTNNWLDAIYFSTVTFTTLGYGDYQPIGYGRFFAAVQALAGYVVLGLTVGAVLHWADERS